MARASRPAPKGGAARAPARHGGGGAPASLWRWLGLALLLVLVDQFTKLLVVGSFELGQGHAVTSFFNLVRVHNSGAAFSLLAQASGWQRWFFTAVGLLAVGLILWLLRAHAGQRLFSFALSCILGGAIGNLIDRMVYGYVVDFLDFHWSGLSLLFAGGHFPAFNLADSAITLGAACLILDELLRVRRSR